MTGAPIDRHPRARCSTSCGCGGRRRWCAATRLEAALGTPARIYYKDESVSPAGSHKPNTAVAQAYYNKQSGTPRLATETGAGQWGSALAFACSQFDLECKVYMVRASYEQKPYRRVLMETWGASVVPSPVDDPTHPGSLGAAISDAVRDAGAARRHALLARFGAQPRAAAPDDHRDRGQGAARARGRDPPRRGDRIVRRRIEPRRDRAAVHDRRRRAAPRRRARIVPDAHRRQVRLRLRRHRDDHAAAPDVHARPRLRAAVDPRRRPALPRRLADHLAAREDRPHGRGRVPAGQDLRGRGAVRAHRGQDPRARDRPRDPRRDRRSARRQGSRTRSA